MNRAGRLDAAHEAAVHELVGNHGIVGVGRGSDQLVFFVRNRRAAIPFLRRWSRGRDVAIEVKDAQRFVHASESRGTNTES